MKDIFKYVLQEIFGLYSKGISVRDIKDQIKELYDVNIFTEMVSNITI